MKSNMDLEVFGRTLNKEETEAMDELASLRVKEVDDSLHPDESKRYMALVEFLTKRNLSLPFGVEI